MSSKRCEDHSAPCCRQGIAGRRKRPLAGLILLALMFSFLPFADAAQPPKAESRCLSLRAAIVHLSATFGAEYPRGKQFLARLDQLEGRLASAPPSEQPRLQSQLDMPGSGNRCWPIR